MCRRIKFIVALVMAVAVLSLFIFVFHNFSRPVVSLTSYLPEPPELAQYALIEGRDGQFPVFLAAFFADGSWSALKRSSAGGKLLSLAQPALDAAVLVALDDFSDAQVSAVYKMTQAQASKLDKGEIPDEWMEVLPGAGVDRAVDKDAWAISWAPDEAPIFYYCDGNHVVLAAGRNGFDKLVGLRAQKKGRAAEWSLEKGWPGHAEIGDGGRLLSGETAVSLNLAWRGSSGTADAPSGEARWSISGLKASQKAALLLAMKPVQWQFASHVTQSAPILVAGFNIPRLPGQSSDWPFPLSTAAAMVRLLGISEEDTRLILSGETVLALGGRNKLLWFNMPGVMAELSGKEPLMRRLVESFWNNFFLDSEVKPLDGWAYGGAISFPFSVVGVGDSDSALIGLIAANTLRDGSWLADYLPGDKRAIGWLFADLPRLGESLYEMAKVVSLLTFEDGEDDATISGGEERRQSGAWGWGEVSGGVEPDVTESLGRLLKNFGYFSAVWESPESGRFYWYNRPARR